MLCAHFRDSDEQTSERETLAAPHRELRGVPFPSHHFLITLYDTYEALTRSD
jgi:hypothetical protein